MNKKLLILLVILFFPVSVNATNANSKVWYGDSVGTCTRNYQDKSITTNGSLYFSHCMEVRCSRGIYYYNNNKVTCSNGNNSPYTEVINNSACDQVKNKCSNGQIRYCSMIVYYDCNRTSNGDSFTTTTKTTTTKVTKRVTTYSTTTTTTTKVADSNTNLSSITLSSGKINFSKDVYEYNIEVDSTVSSINVSAIPEDKSSTIKITGNDNIKNGSVIKITVTGTDKQESIYTIKVKKKEEKKLSNNARLKSLKVRNHEFAFNSKITDYSITIENNEYELDIYELEAEDTNASIDVKNNTNLTKGSIVSIVVTAEDGKTINTYNINISVKRKSNLIKYLFIIILILAVLAGAYYIYKKVVLSRTGDKYEYE